MTCAVSIVLSASGLAANAALLPGYAVFGKNAATNADTFMHVDLNIAYSVGTGGNPGAWNLGSIMSPPQPGFRPSGLYAPNEALYYVGAGTTTVLNADFAPLGAAAGQTVYLIPQDFPDTEPITWAGVGAEQNTAAQFVGGTVRLNLLSVDFTPLAGQTGAGNFVLFSNATGGNPPNVRMANANGISTDDFLTVAVGAHTHYNFGFSDAGFYAVTLQAVGTPTDGGATQSNPATYYFGVLTTQNLQAAVVPEPSTALLSLSGLSLGISLVVRRKRTHRP